MTGINYLKCQKNHPLDTHNVNQIEIDRIYNKVCL